MNDAQQFDWTVNNDESDADINMDDQNLEATESDDVADDEDDNDAVDRFDVDGKITEAVDAVLAARRKQLLDSASDDKVRKAVPILPSDRKRIRRRNVDTDVAVSDLAFDAVLALFAADTEVEVATERAAKNRKDRITLTAPSWWWGLVGLAADAYDGQASDVIATAINKHLP